jgi:hypothetical protein
MKLILFSATVVLFLSALAHDLPIKDTKHPLQEVITQIVKYRYPVEKVGVVARSVTFPAVLDQGQEIIDSTYPNATILCMDVANYAGLVTGLIWSMDRELVEEHGLQHLIDQASTVLFTCVFMFMPGPTQDSCEAKVAYPHAIIAVTVETKEITPTVSIESAKKAVATQIEHIQKILKFAQTVRSKESE